MESDQCDQGGGGDDQDGLKQVTNVLRSYECNFCKRGFSNAQALGGHMNIHRKDKAKLKQQSSNLEQGNSSEELNKLLPNFLNSNIVLPQKQDQQRVPSRSEEILVIDHKRQQLPLFSESPTKNEMQNQQGGKIHQREITTTTTATTTTQEALLLSNDQGSSLELDLELRLGSEPHDSSKPTGTRKFF